jgi:serine/threonine-protein kinase
VSADAGSDPRREADRILSEALELAAEERGRYVAEACGGDAALRARVERLLLAADSPELAPGGALAGPLGLSWLEDRSRDGDESPGQRLGPWRLLREIGRGGMAVVFLAERADGQFAQQVAIKL